MVGELALRLLEPFSQADAAFNLGYFHKKGGSPSSQFLSSLQPLQAPAWRVDFWALLPTLALGLCFENCQYHSFFRQAKRTFLG